MKTKVLTTSELNQILISKGYSGGITINPESNIWGADRLFFQEYGDGFSTCGLYKFCPLPDMPESGNLKSLANYAKLNASNKRIFIQLVENL